MRRLTESWRWLWRDLRHGELTLLLLALLLAVAATTSLRFFSSGLEKHLQQEAARLLAADIVIRSSRPIADPLAELASAQHLQHARTLEFSSVLVNDDQFQLAAVKAASAGYPLRGELRLRENGHDKSVRALPERGAIWVDERLLALLKAAIGDVVQLGDSRLRITAVLAYEPDQRGFGFSPRALMNLDDVAASHIVQPGSRLRYQLLLSGNARNIDAFRKVATPRLGLGARLLDIREDRPEIGTPMARAQSYFSLATLLAVMLAGLAIITSTRRFAERHYDTLALLRCLGASRRDTLQLVLGEIAWVWLLALLGGALLGAMVAVLLRLLLSNLFPGDAPLLALGQPLLTGIATATLTLAGFALPTLLRLGRVSPLRVLRREMPAPSWSLLTITAGAWLALLLLMMLETGQIRLTLIIMVGGGVLAWLTQWLLRLLLQGLRRRYHHPVLTAAFRHPAASSTQILGLALGLAALLLITSLRSELLQAWEQKIPPDAPNQFALNIASDERDAFIAFLKTQHLKTEVLYPIIRGRLTAINGKPLPQTTSKNDNNRESNRGNNHEEALNRELNLTWSDNLPTGNTLQQGLWWTQNNKPDHDVPVSVEQKLAQRLGLKLNDHLHFTLAEGDLDAYVSNLRTVDWDSFHPNFYFIFPPGALDNFPASYLTSFRTNTAQRSALNVLVRQFPTVVLIDVDAVMQEIRHILDQVSQAIEAILFFVLAGGLLVIVSQIMANLDERRFEAALLRVIGSSRRELQRRLLAEFITLGAAAGVVAALLNEVIAAVVYWQILELTPVLHPALWWQAPLAGAVLVTLAALPGARQIWTASPLRKL